MTRWDLSEPFSNMFDYWSNFWGFGIASNGKRENSSSNMFEATRKYYTSKFAIYFGVPTVFSPNYLASFDTKYFDNFSIPNNMWLKFDPTPLKKNMEKVCRFPIKSNEQDNQPRLLTISTEVLDGATVVFDSYQLKSEYPEKENPSHTITYENGLLPEHIMASASVPINYEFTRLKDDKGNDRNLWDGALLSNTPLAELLLSHHDYWWKKYRNVPDIESVYMINVNPTKQETLPQNHDEAVSRCFDILLSDKTKKTKDGTIGITNLVDLIGNYREIIIKLVNNLSPNLGREQKNQIVQVLKRFYLSEDLQNQKTVEYRKGIIERISFEIESQIHQALKNEIDKKEEEKKGNGNTAKTTNEKEDITTRGINSTKEKKGNKRA